MDESQKHYAEWKKPDTKGCIWICLYEILAKAKLYWQKKDQWLPGNGSGLNENRHKGIFGDDGNVLHHNCGGGYMIEYICLHLSSCTVKVAIFYWRKLFLNKANLKNHIQNLSLCYYFTATLGSCSDNWICLLTEAPYCPFSVHSQQVLQLLRVARWVFVNIHQVL